MMQAAIHGRLGRDPVTRTTRNGNEMASTTVAVDVTGHGDETERTAWVDLTCFGRLAEQLARHGKGDMVSASGRLTLRVWTDREGNERQGWQMVANSLVSARTVRPGGRKKGDGERAGNQRQDAPFDDALPF